eukprot:scaffold4852_cov50-Attheya_sp.AAC.5
MGASMEVAKYTEKLVPSTRFVAVDGVAPFISETAAFVAPSANVIGNVSMGPNSSVWYGATVRGDVNKVTIGANTSIGDRAMVHVAKIQGDFCTVIGDNVTVGPGAIVHAATLGDNVVIGPCAQILDGATVESRAKVSAGAVVTPGTTVKSGELWAGAPAKMVRALTPDEIASMLESVEETANLAAMHATECSKSYEELVADEAAMRDKAERDPDYWQPKNWTEQGQVQGQGSPGRIFDNTLSHPEEGLKQSQNQK